MIPRRPSNLTPLQGWRVAPRKPLGLEDCCLIIATYQRSAEVLGLIQKLSDLADAPAEVLVVDASPTNQTEQGILECTRDISMPFELTYVRSPKGLTRQRNVGVDISTKPFLFFLDDDAVPLGGYFTELRRVLLEDTEETIAAAGACIVNEIDKAIPRRWRIRRAIGLIPQAEPLIYNHTGTSGPGGLIKPFSGVRDVDIFAGGACAIRRTVLDLVRFSEFFNGYSWGEDLEMSLRIRQRWRVVYCGEARVVHYGVQCHGGRPAVFAKGQMEVRNRYFIWKRYSRDARVVDKVRFRLDLLFLFLMDLAWFVAQPWNGRHLLHACGLATGAARCAIAPPTWEDPAPTPRYCLAVKEDGDRRSACCIQGR